MAYRYPQVGSAGAYVGGATVDVSVADWAAGGGGLTRALFVTGTGNIVMTMADGVDLTFTAVPANSWLSVAVSAIKHTGTTATGIIAFY